MDHRTVCIKVQNMQTKHYTLVNRHKNPTGTAIAISTDRCSKLHKAEQRSCRTLWCSPAQRRMSMT